ncbi:TldD/PmbA family protein [Phenylobacterium montanum]|uniref:TldD/PmbA family protein n=1 Tax=Phenylobacterium montanum TaxID=2823693 RepID=A0A975FXG0_9CAUL|nr:metallopeptidase TldD-related protein [Caulobacter sp. S6]QUD87200.1 TldD/PmbA family protein [Caulobacter sp. S6]
MDENLLQDLVSAALKAGADAAEAVGAERQSLSISVRMGKLEEVEREEARDLGLRVFIGKRQASVSGSDLSAAARARLVERAVAMARLAPEEPYAGLAPSEILSRGPWPELDLFDPTEPTAAELEDQALAAESTALATPGVTNSEGGSAGWSSSAWRLVTSNGFSGPHAASGFSISASVVAGDENGMERGGEGRSQRWQADLPTPEAIGAEAGKRAVSRLGARKIASTTAPVIFENRLAMSLIGPMLGAIAGPAIARGASFLKDRLGEQIFPAGFVVAEDPHRRRGLGSSPFDDEGVANHARNLIDDGVLTTWLLNCSSAKQLGLTTTGHASRGLAGSPGVSTTNLTVRPGTLDQAGLMRDAGEGLLVTSMFGPSLNPHTGDWSVGVSGFWFEKGEMAYPVTEITVAGNLVDIYQRLVAGSDLEIRGASNSPSLLVDALAIAGR